MANFTPTAANGNGMANSTFTAANRSDTSCTSSAVTVYQFVMTFCLASPVALIGVFCNSFMVQFFGQPAKRNSPTLYLTVSAFLDATICIIYVLLFGADAAANFLKIHWLFVFSTYSCIGLLIMSRIAQFLSPWIIILATVERWILIAGHESRGRTRHLFTYVTSSIFRHIVILALIFVAIGLRVIGIFEWKIEYKNCSDPFAQVGVTHSDLVNKEWYQIYSFYVIPVLQSFVVFPLLILLNVVIIRALKRRLVVRRRQSSPIPYYGVSEELTPLAVGVAASAVVVRQAAARRQTNVEQRRVKNATHTLIAIATLYILCTSMDMFLKILEHVPGQPLLTDDDGNETELWNTFSDVISLLFMLNSFLRVFIYITFNSETRRELLEYYFPGKHKTRH